MLANHSPNVAADLTQLVGVAGRLWQVAAQHEDLVAGVELGVAWRVGEHVRQRVLLWMGVEE